MLKYEETCFCVNEILQVSVYCSVLTGAGVLLSVKLYCEVIVKYVLLYKQLKQSSAAH